MKFILLGITQGLTEFLPISSSAHLYILKKYLQLDQNLLPFFTLLHLATLLSICVFLRKEIISILSKKKVLIHLGIITAITALLGLLIEHMLGDFFGSRFLVPILLLINAGILFCSKNITQKKDYNDISFKDSIILGIVQGLAVLPGISRSGVTIVALLRRGFKVKEAFALSFLMAIPAIVGVFLFKFKQLLNSNIPASSMVMGSICAFFFGLLALTVVRKTLINQKFDKFGYYCIIIALVSLVVR